MSTALTLEVIPPCGSSRRAATTLPASDAGTPSTHIARIKTYHAGVHRAYTDHIGYAFLAGVAFLQLKDSVEHGQFEQLCKEQLPDISKRSRVRYMTFADHLMVKSATVALLAKEPRLLTNASIAEEDARVMSKAVHDFTDGKALTELYRDLGIIRQPKKQKHTAPGPLTADDALAAKNAEHKALFNAVTMDINDLLTAIESSPDNPLVNPDCAVERAACKDAITALSRKLKIRKPRKPTTKTQ